MIYHDFQVGFGGENIKNIENNENNCGVVFGAREHSALGVTGCMPNEARMLVVGGN